MPKTLESNNQNYAEAGAKLKIKEDNNKFKYGRL